MHVRSDRCVPVGAACGRLAHSSATGVTYHRLLHAVEECLDGLFSLRAQAIGVAFGVTGSRTNDVSSIQMAEFWRVFVVALLVSTVWVYFFGSDLLLLGVAAGLSVAAAAAIQRIQKGQQRGRHKRSASEDLCERL